MDADFYILESVKRWPAPPAHWSFTALTLFEECPRRWGLTYAAYDNASTPYPQLASTSALTGEFIHFLLEHFAKELKDPRGRTVDKIRREFAPRSRLKTYISSIQRSPRQRLIANAVRRVSIDDCINTFKRISSEWSAASDHAVLSTSDAPPAQAAELFIRLDSPRILGRIDAVRNGHIIDFKTGAPDAKHTEQIWLYGLLYWRSFNDIPQSGTLVYANGEAVTIPFTLEGLRDAEASVASRVEAADTIVKEGAFPARINEMCPRCPIRHMCVDYWQSDQTTNARVTPGIVATLRETGQPFFADADVSNISITQANKNMARGTVLGIGEVYFPAPPNGLSFREAKILNARVSLTHNEPVLNIVSSTEIFWRRPRD